MRAGGTSVTAVVGGGLAAVMLAASGSLWTAVQDAGDAVDRVRVFDGLADRPMRTVNGSVDVLVVVTDRVKDARRMSYGVLAHVSRRHDQTVLAVLPRGALVDVPAHTGRTGKDVAAGRRPLATAYADGGPRLAVQAFESSTQVRLDGYAELSLPGAGRLVEDLGGMDVCVPVAVRDADAKLRLAPGPRHLSGAQALAYLRTAGGGPLDQVRHAQLLTGAVIERLFGRSAALTPGTGGALLTSGARALRVDEGFDLGLARRLTLALRDAYGDRVVLVPVPDAANTAADHLFEQLRTDAEIDPSLVTPVTVDVRPESVRVAVRNGTGVEGLAGDATRDLTGLGFGVRGEPENASRRVPATTVYHHPRYERQARAVRAAIPGSRLATRKTSTPTILVVLGGNYTGVRQVTYAENGADADAESGDPVTANGPCG